MPDSEQKNILQVQASESGQKLLQFLVRRLSLPQSLLHRWIRTGQIRLNGGRVKPFTLVTTGDSLRLPPFAIGMNHSADFEKGAKDRAIQSSISGHAATENFPFERPTQEQVLQEQALQERHDEFPFSPSSPSPSFLRARAHINKNLPPPLYHDEHIAIYNKPQGLPIHSGTGHTDSFAQRLQGHFSQCVFKPTPAHRLDKDTSGLVCVAFSYAALRALQDAFIARHIAKEYVTWVHGIWPHEAPCKLVHHMDKKYIGPDEKVRILSAQEGKEAVSYAQCLQRTAQHSLMHIRLITGRTHQIRLQMAAQGHPVLGDGKYGSTAPHAKLFLHSLRITLPQTEVFTALNLAGKEFAVLPTWEKHLAVASLPAALIP